MTFSPTRTQTGDGDTDAFGTMGCDCAPLRQGGCLVIAGTRPNGCCLESLIRQTRKYTRHKNSELSLATAFFVDVLQCI